MKKPLLFLIMAILFFPIALSATLEGTIYDLSLEMTEDVRISIDTTPSQLIISKDSTYSFNIPIGDYILIAEQYNGETIIASSKESINIQDDGTYVLDIILFPTFEEMQDESEFIDSSADELIDAPDYSFLLIMGLLIFLFYIIWRKLNQNFWKKVSIQKTTRKPVKKAMAKVEKAPPILPPDLLKLYAFIQKHKRTTQKEIRKVIPLSEAKISLMIADLEARNLIKKVKKGRGNIIILK